jgi:hypothetical protein
MRLKPLSWLVAVLWVVGSPGLSAAEDTVAPAAPEAPAPPSRWLQGPGDLDVRLHLDGDILLAFAELGAAADFGVLPLGPGALAVGAEFSAGMCLTACGLIGLLTGIDVSSRFYSPHARLTYHFLPPHQKLDALDIYGLLLAGVTVSTQALSGSAQGVGFRYTGTGTGPSVGLGVGAKRFFKERLFLGGEARLRYARGEYHYSEEVAGISFEGVDPNWSQTGLTLLFFGGVRL